MPLIFLARLQQHFNDFSKQTQQKTNILFPKIFSASQMTQLFAAWPTFWHFLDQNIFFFSNTLSFVFVARLKKAEWKKAEWKKAEWKKVEWKKAKWKKTETRYYNKCWRKISCILIKKNLGKFQVKNFGVAESGVILLLITFVGSGPDRMKTFRASTLPWNLTNHSSFSSHVYGPIWSI